MNTLIIDTSREKLLVILDKQGEVFIEKCLDETLKHMRLLFSKIDEIIKKSGLAIKDIDCFAAVIGPGSYTGIRIGACAMTAMAKAGGKKLVSVNSLELLAEGQGNGLYLIDNGHDYYALEVGGVQQNNDERNNEKQNSGKQNSSKQSSSKHNDNEKQNYFILEKGGEKNKKYILRDDSKFYGEELLSLVRRKIKLNIFDEALKPFYMKKSQAGQNAPQVFLDNPDILI